MYDLIVCGAGPAGAMAAATAARAGLQVLLLEKQRLPRYKACGGGMPMVAGEHLRDLAPAAFLEADTRFMRHTWNYERAFLAPINPPGADPEITIWMVQRSVFDHALAQRAVRAGAELREETAVGSVEADRSGVTVRGTRAGVEWSERARYLVGADGANGIIAKCARLRQRRGVAVAVEVEHPHAWGAGHPDLRPDVLHLEFGAVPRGYAWVFPKQDHLSIGAGIFRLTEQPGAAELMRGAVYRYLDALQVPYSREALRFHAHPIPIWNRRERLHTRDGRIMLAGDAAGLVNPLFGDGILHAVRSGILAAECAAADTVEDYTRRIHAQFAGPFSNAARLASILTGWEALLYEHAILRPRATRVAASILCGGALTPELMAFLLSRARTVLRGARKRETPATAGG